jgi:hypothetical protein
VRIYGGGSADAEFLRQLSQLVGNVYLPQASRSYNGAAGPDCDLPRQNPGIYQEDGTRAGPLPGAPA